ncbi:Gfo/Idh/MocA family protein [Planctomyces sp. SH-PL62]|uniref:Gfo/Idh/MocA family protein n=1 Tax=Planctomyces sp. SH-PL62 TaxID=1636152 RepID=UPI00078C0E9E|nr:Gfo/Idh/MocA family oxidoreductase [Planctomyces sp. SH-PL62]AMV38555.1 Inositol 2-dehydrogenase [Planctomyces sp. SH-PL62]
MSDDSTMAPGTPGAAPSRRQFHKAAAAAALGVFAAPAFVRGRNLNEKLDIACIGVGGRGAGNLGDVSSENIVALCDVYDVAVERAAETRPHARKYRDFRKLYDDLKKYDAVVVSTTEHTHAFAVLPALQLGKHVYCEKPLTHDIWEARLIREAAGKAKVATQMGTQIHAGDNYRRVVELIQAGAIGAVKDVHVWVGRAWGRQSPEEAKANGDIVSVTERPAGSSPIPAGLDWDLWIGPVKSRPFHEVYFPGPKWYRWWDFGNGTMSDLGSHWIDLPFWALKLKAPSTIEAFGPPPHAEIAPASMKAVYEYEAKGDQPATRLTWYQGAMKPEPWSSGAIPKWDSGVLFVGEKGMLLSDYGRHLLLPEDEFRDYKRPEPTIPASLGHHAEWIHACKTGAPTTCNFEYAGWLTEANHLGNVAYRVGGKLEWDAAALKATNASEADALIRRDYRPGWSLG